MKIKTQKNRFILFILISIFSSCQKKEEDKLKCIYDNKKLEKIELTIIYEKNFIKIIENRPSIKNFIDTTFLKKHNSSYIKIKDEQTFKPIILLLKDTLYSDQDFANRTDYLIYKSNDLYVSIEDIYGISKYRSVIYYDTLFKIHRIEKYYGDYKYVFESEIFNRFNRNFHSNKNDLINKKQSDSINYMQKFTIQN